MQWITCYIGHKVEPSHRYPANAPPQWSSRGGFGPGERLCRWGSDLLSPRRSWGNVAFQGKWCPDRDTHWDPDTQRRVPGYKRIYKRLLPLCCGAIRVQHKCGRLLARMARRHRMSSPPGGGRMRMHARNFSAWTHTHTHIRQHPSASSQYRSRAQREVLQGAGDSTGGRLLYGRPSLFLCTKVQWTYFSCSLQPGRQKTCSIPTVQPC